jgi:hypothetical protein
MSLPINQAFVVEFEKSARTRAQQEVRRALAAGDEATAGTIAKGYGRLGLAPRYVKDISGGGQEAAVDMMMGKRTGPSQEVQGLFARKLYKPDSSISRGDYTSQLLEQKQRMTDAARRISPEAKSMVPAMLGHETRGTGPLQRHLSYHEYVPGIGDIRKTPNPTAQLDKVEQGVLDPMKAKGMTMSDTISNRGGSRGANYGNVVSTPRGPKVLDFLPSVRGESNPAIASMKHYGLAGTETSSFGAEGATNIGKLRKEVFRPQMRIQPGMATAAASGVQPVKQVASAAQGLATSVPAFRKAPSIGRAIGSLAKAI